MDCIGAFSEVLYSHPNILSHILPIITSAIRNPDSALCATMALKDITRDCTEIMGPFAQDVLLQCQKLLSSNELKNGECIRLMVRVYCQRKMGVHYYKYHILISVPNRQNALPSPSRPDNAIPRTDSYSSLVGVTRDDVPGADFRCKAAFNLHIQAAHLAFSIFGHLEGPGASSAGRERSKPIAAVDDTLPSTDALREEDCFKMDARL